MHRLAIALFLIVVSLLVPLHSTSSQNSATTIKWRECLRQKPDWYKSAEAQRVAQNLLLYQRGSGGWPKNTEMAAVLNEAEAARIAEQKKTSDATIDNQSTYTQLAYLARVIEATGNQQLHEPFFKGLDYLLAAQYQNGGWPQFYPNPSGYQKHITFNDDAMIGVMRLLRDIARRQPAYAFVDETRRAHCARAVSKGVECILKCQIKVAGRRTAWCAQHDEITFQPAPARTYEKISLSGGETVEIVRFLMESEQQTGPVTEAIRAAVVWLEEAKLSGIKIVDQRDSTQARGFDRIVVPDPNAAPVWARFYEIGTNRPIFCGRDGVIKSSLAEIEYERRTGYRWYVNSPAELLAKDYPAWLERGKAGRRQTAVGRGQ